MSYTSASFYCDDDNLAYIEDQIKGKKRYNKSNWFNDLVDHLRAKDEKTKVDINKENSLSVMRVVEIYNDYFSGTHARQKQVVTDSLKSSIRSRIKNDFKTEESWVDLFNVIKESDFLMGSVQVGDRKPFQLALEWIIKPANMAKILEGTYHGN